MRFSSERDRNGGASSLLSHWQQAMEKIRTMRADVRKICGFLRKSALTLQILLFMENSKGTPAKELVGKLFFRKREHWCLKHFSYFQNRPFEGQ